LTDAILAGAPAPAPVPVVNDAPPALPAPAVAPAPSPVIPQGLPLSGLRIDGITGDFGGEMAVESYSFAPGRAGGPAAGEFRFTLREGQAMPALFLADASGKHFAKAAFTQRTVVNDKTVETQRFTLSDVCVTSFQTKDGHDEVTLSFARLQE